MVKSVLIISSSPRINSNSDILCEQFANGAKTTGNTVEMISLKEKKVNYCLGCGFCIINNYTACSQHDDMEEILNKIIAADVVLLASPVYFYTINAQMKTIIDRCCAKYTQIRDKEFYIILTASDADVTMLDRGVECFRGFFDCLENVRIQGIIKGAGLEGRGEVKKNEYMKIAYNMGKNV